VINRSKFNIKKFLSLCTYGPDSHCTEVHILVSQSAKNSEKKTKST
jgi:hypothetical protein